MGARLFITSTALVAALACTCASAQTAESGHQANSVAVNAVDINVVAQMKALVDALAPLDTEKFEKLEGAPDQAEALAAALARVSNRFVDVSNNNRVTQITNAAGKFTTTLNGASAATKKILQQDGDASENLNKLLLAIQDLKLTDAGLVVRVLEAKFGDTYPVNTFIEKRWCDATAYMRAACDRQPKCSLATNYQDQVCGFNPAPSAEARYRGLYVRYECVRNIEANFVAAYGTHGSAAGPVRLQMSRDKYVVLRGSGSLICGAAK